MLPCTTLRIECGDGSAILDYRIDGSYIEMRIWRHSKAAASSLFQAWRRLTVDQLIEQVESNPVLSRWLQRRVGIRALLRACAGLPLQ